MEKKETTDFRKLGSWFVGVGIIFLAIGLLIKIPNGKVIIDGIRTAGTIVLSTGILIILISKK
jgi:hypothetical protein